MAVRHWSLASLAGLFCLCASRGAGAADATAAAGDDRAWAHPCAHAATLRLALSWSELEIPVAFRAAPSRDGLLGLLAPQSVVVVLVLSPPSRAPSRPRRVGAVTQ